MKDEDIVRLSKGIKIKKQIDSVDIQIENIQQVNIIKLFKTEEWNKSHKQINFDIPIDGVHPYSQKANDFLDSYIQFLKQKKIDLQTEFDNL